MSPRRTFESSRASWWRISRTITRPVRNLRMMWKLLIPSLVLILLVGTTGAYWTVRFLTSKAQVGLDSELLRRSVDAQVLLRDDSLYLLESLRFAANIEGVAEAITQRDGTRASTLLASVVAVRTRLDLLVATDGTGKGLVETERNASGVASAQGTMWPQAFVADVLGGRSGGDKRGGFVNVGSRTFVAIAGPVRTGTDASVGVIVAGMDVTEALRDASGRVGSPIALYAGRLLGEAGRPFEPVPPSAMTDRPLRRRERIGGESVEVAYSQVDLQGGLHVTLAVSLPAAPAFASVHGAGSRLAVVLTAAMLAGVLLATVLSRLMLGQVKLLVEANRALGRGDLSARVPVLGHDELGELAGGLNLMAEQLEASYNELEMRVAARTEELRRLHQSRSEFFAAIGHEFRTPLFAIKGHADLMLDEDFRPSDRAWVGEFGTTIKESADQLLDRVDEILELARCTSGHLELDLTDLDLAEVVGGLDRQMAALARRSELTLAIEVPDSLPAVRADLLRLQQILLNLVSNAVKYTPPGGRVGVSARIDGDQVAIDVIDTGIGVPVGVGDDIFEPFYQVKGSQPQHGESSSGLGLALTKRLVEVHGGTIAYTSAPDRGTTFTVCLPHVKKSRGRRRQLQRTSVT